MCQTFAALLAPSGAVCHHHCSVQARLWTQWMAALSNIQHLSSHTAQGGQQIGQNQSINVWGYKVRENVQGWILSMCMCECFIFFFISSSVILQWAVVAIQHMVHWARPFHSHQLAAMCNTVQPAAGCACQRASVRVCTTSVALRCHLRVGAHANPDRVCWRWLLQRWVVLGQPVGCFWFLHRRRVCVRPRVQQLLCPAQRLIVYIYYISGSSFLPRCLTGSTKWESMSRNSSCQARYANVIGNTVDVGQSNRRPRWGFSS